MEGYVTVEANATEAKGRALVSGDNGRFLGVSWVYPGGVTGLGWPFGKPDESSTVETINNALRVDVISDGWKYGFGEYRSCSWWQ